MTRFVASFASGRATRPKPRRELSPGPWIAVIVVIIFQSDIRRALARMGRRPLLRGQRTAKETQTIEEVIKAAGTLAQKRIGALMAFERSAALDEFIERGTEVDAAVSKELLHSIFVPSFENPMHDGAVVIRDVAAGTTVIGVPAKPLAPKPPQTPR